MWSRQNKVWLHYTKDVMAADAIDAAFLVRFQRHSYVQRLHLTALEIIDLQRYKIIKKPAKIHNTLHDQAPSPLHFRGREKLNPHNTPKKFRLFFM